MEEMTDLERWREMADLEAQHSPNTGTPRGMGLPFTAPPEPPKRGVRKPRLVIRRVYGVRTLRSSNV